MKPRLPEIPGLPDRYQLRKYIARTDYGAVVEAHNRDHKTMVALKILRAEGSKAGVARAMFRREVEALRGLDHPAIVKIIDAFECDESLLVIELELIPGGQTLSDMFEEVRIGRLPRPSPEWRIRTASRLADAVIEAHRRDIIHRDIKPGNVLWNVDDESLKLADFGIAAVLPLTVSEPSGMTLRSFYTRPFASPEQLLQKAPGTGSDVYAFGLLVGSLIAMSEPEQNFEPAELGGFIAAALADLRGEGVSAYDVDELGTTLNTALSVDPSARPSMATVRDILARVQLSLAPRQQAGFVLTNKARDKIQAAGFANDASILDDLNSELCIQIDRVGERIKIFGQSLFAVLVVPNEDDDCTLLAVDAGQNPGPVHESHRRAAEACPIRLRLASGTGRPLLDFAQEADRQATRRATSEIVERARLIVRLERERLPAFVIEAQVEGGRYVPGRRAIRIGQASGFEGAQVESVEVSGGFRLRVLTARYTSDATTKNTVKSRLEARGVAFDEMDESVESPPDSDWYSVFEDPREVEILDQHGHIAGKVTRFDKAKNEIHVSTDKTRNLPRVGEFLVKNQQKERQLRQQEMAIDALERGETARADMPRLLAEAAAHHMGEKRWIELIQRGLTPTARVQDLVDRILASETVFCLQGPPGTGKTTIIAEVVAQTLAQDPCARVLVCAQANDAVANAIERILKLRGQLGQPWIIVRDVREQRARLEGDWAGYEAAYTVFVDRVKLGVEAAAGGKPHPAARDWLDRVEHRTADVERDYDGLVQVWGTTTARSTKPLDGLEGESYDLVIIDEAAKATVGEALIPIAHARRLLLVGDQKQLPPFLEDTTVEALRELGISEEEAKYSLFEHLMALLPKDHRDMLDTQFRMHPTIGSLVSRLFYDGKLHNGKGTEDRPLPPGMFDRTHRVMWIDVVGRDYTVNETSRANDKEREVIVALINKLDEDARAAGMKLEIAVIAAYRGQADKLQSELHERADRWKAASVKAATVDAFQGREADVVLYSLVRTGAAERRFIADGRRFNVGLSRAKSLLIMVGDKTGARGTARLQELLDMIPGENQLASETFMAGASSRRGPRTP